MKITTIEIKGFKSFPDKTVVHFDQAITGIVGPNGCGKSNIVDAIRWVVGEQKISSLRSENLENLVFNGSKSRSPSGLAEVKITFENTRNLLATEFNTVEIARRFYRTGESEYLINGIVCRLKDIQNLLLDTGISSDSYAIIELGMIDDIIRDKDNSRRKMLEQAAGISIFKTRKRETELKLQATDLDLKRLEDILFEINNQLKDLESQARRAQRYIELRKQYKEVSIRYSKFSLKNVSQMFSDLNRDESALAAQVDSLRVSLTTLDTSLEKEKLESLQHEQKLRHTQTLLNQLDQQIAEYRNQKNLGEQQKTYNQDRVHEAHRFLEEADKQTAYLRESIAFTSSSIEEEKIQVDTLQQQVDEKKRAADILKEQLLAHRSSLNLLLQQSQKLQQERFDIEKKIALFDAQIQNAKLLAERRKQQNADYQQQISQHQEQRTHLNTQLAEQENQLTQKTEVSAQTKDHILALQSHVEQERAALVALQRKKDAKQNELALIKNLLETLEGYPDSVKYLHKNQAWGRGVLLSDILFVKHDFRVSVERFLEPYMNYYVVSDPSNAQQGIALLKHHQKGKVNFFLLSSLTQRTPHTPTLPTPEGCLPAIEVLEVEEQYMPIAKHLLHNVFIQQDVASEPQSLPGATMIARDGTWIHAEHTMSGGSVGAFEGNRTGRKRSIEKLQEEIHTLQEEIEQKNKIIAEIQQQLLDANQRLKENDTEQIKLSIVQTKERIKSLEDKWTNATQQVADGERFIEENEKKIEALQQDMASTYLALEQKQQEEESKKTERNTLEAQLLQEEDHYQKKQQDHNETQILFTKQQNKVTTLQNDLQYKHKQLEDIEQQKQYRTTELHDLQKSIAEAETKTTTLHEQLSSLLQEREQQHTTLREMEHNVDLRRNHILEEERKLRQLQSEKETLERKDTQLKERINTLRLEMSSIKERLLLEFKIDIEEMMKAEDFYPAEAQGVSIDDLKLQMEKNKRSIENLGEVNPMAVEAYDTHKKRYDFILQQKADLLEAKQNLLATIQEVEQTVNQSFNETFNQVRTHFQRVFKKLFTEEDTADLVLDKPDDIYETGIDIVAKPKGKRPASIHQLSGGEKTLTSIALLFSLYLIKPAPFCVLDEVDAPLDDANVGKFTQMIREFSRDSQFIIVTHNKATMASVDVIYGITMQETGVSRMVPVDFRSLN